MTIVLPDHLAWVNELCGDAWPTVDEDHLFDFAAGLRWYSTVLRDLDSNADRVARDVVMNNDARFVEAFGVRWRRSHFNHYLAAEALDLFSQIVASTALAIQSAKITMIGVLALVATRLVDAKATAFRVPGAAAGDAFRAVAAGQVAIAYTRQRLLLFIEAEIAGRMHDRATELLGRIPSGESASVELRQPASGDNRSHPQAVDGGATTGEDQTADPGADPTSM